MGEEILSKINNLLSEFSAFKEDNSTFKSSLHARLKRLEDQAGLETEKEEKFSDSESDTRGETQPSQVLAGQANVRPRPGPEPIPAPPRMQAFRGPVENTSESWRQDFDSIKESLSRVRLPNDLRLSDNKSGIPSKDREHAAILSKCARFMETSLKLLSEIQDNYDKLDLVASCVDQIYITQVAGVRYLQEEFNALQVGGQYGMHMKQIFRSLQKNTSQYTPETIENLKTASIITGNVMRQQTPSFGSHSGNSQFQFRPRNSFRGGPRPKFRGGFRNQWQNPGYQPRGIPPARDLTDDAQA